MPSCEGLFLSSYMKTQETTINCQVLLKNRRVNWHFDIGEC